jgi:hypothetical protein
MTRKTELRVRFDDNSTIDIGFVGKQDESATDGQKKIQEWLSVNFDLGELIIQNEL